ncbi:MAG: HEAT repeat domain-containing protein [Opitutaceae bacterium]|nr:HEAT repeat domain-containing protein [Opitutaceae bacterium]
MRPLLCCHPFALVATLTLLGGCARSASDTKPIAANTASAAKPAAAGGGANAGTAAAPVPRATHKFATQTLSVPEGFTVELVAGPPLVNRPISIAFDERGRLYATDSSGLSDKSDKQFALKPHRIVRLEDTDGDGRFEKSTVFAEKMMFPQGALFYEGSLYVAAPPHIWKITDDNDDGVSDRREVWYDGKTLTGCANDVHGPYLGPDGWMYWTKGAFAEQRHTLPNGKTMVTRAAHIFRSRPDGTGEEPVLTGGMDNPVGVTFTSTGERFLNGTFFQLGVAGKRDGIIHSIYGGLYGKEQPALAGHVRTGDLMPIMTHMGAAAPCGSLAYRSRGFGDGFTDNLFICYFNLRKIGRHELVPDGATFTTRDTDFVTSDSQDFRPTDVLEDADGSLLIVDTGGWYKICCPTSQMSKPDVLGGIYRIRKNGAGKAEDPRGLKLPWATMSPVDLAKLLGDERADIRDRAIHLLGRKGEPVVATLADIAVKGASAGIRRNALWALSRIDAPAARAAVRPALNDRDPSVVHTAVHVTSLWRDSGAVEALGRLAAGSDPALTRRAAEALGRIGDARGVKPLLAATRKLGDTKTTPVGAPAAAADRILEHSLIYALIEIGRPDELHAQLANATVRVARAAMVALDQMEGGGLKPEHVLRWLDSSTAMLKQTATWIVGNHSEWGGALTSYYRERLPKAAGDPERAELQATLAQLAKSPAIQDLLASVAADAKTAPEPRLLALRAMATSGLKATPARWLTDLPALLASGDGTIMRQAVATVKVLPMPKGGNAALSAALARVGRDSTMPADVRLDAMMTAAPAALAPIDPPLFDFLCAHLDAKQPMLVRQAAATVLGKAPLSGPQRLVLAEQVKTVGPLEAPKLLPAFEKSPNEEIGLKLVASLKDSPALAGLRGNTLKPIFARYPASVQKQGDELLTRLNADAAGQNARVDELLPLVSHGDIRRGQALFNSEKTACALCHTIGYLGGRLGPDLTSIGQIRNERELLEAVLFPSATFIRGYEPFAITTRAGESFTGIIKKDTAEEVILATGPQIEQRIARADIAEFQPGTVSPMPPGMDVVLTKEELADLVAFLKARQR